MKQSVILLLLLLSAPLLHAEEWDSDTRPHTFEERLGVNFGLSSHFSRCDYLSERYAAFAMGFYGQTSWGSVISVDAVISSAKAHKDFHTGEGWIYKGERLEYCEILFNYGQIVKETPRYSIYPFAGIGIQGYAIPSEEDGYYDMPNKNGFTIDAGMCFNLRLKQREFFSHGLRFMPYLSVTRYAQPLNWVPAINLSVTYTFESMF